MKKQKRVVVMSLGGSTIIPEDFDLDFLKHFKRTILKFQNKYKFVIVIGGGIIARKYINALRDIQIQDKMQALVGIAVTRLNARFMTYLFGKDANEGIPHDMKQVKNLLRKNNFVFCGGLRYHPNETSDTTAAKLANYFETNFVNMTNVQGLYNKNPKKYKNAKLIERISWNGFSKMADKIKFKPGQNFVLDQKSSRIIKQNKIKTYIISKDLKNFENLLNNKYFKGTVING